MAYLRVAAVQMNSHDDVGKNLDTVRTRVAEAKAGGASLVLLPENFAFMAGATSNAATSPSRSTATVRS